jgi:hypothetical protein
VLKIQSLGRSQFYRKIAWENVIVLGKNILLWVIVLLKMCSWQMSFEANVFLGKCPLWQRLLGNIFWANVFLGKCLSRQMFFWANVLLANVYWSNVFMVKK